MELETEVYGGSVMNDLQDYHVQDLCRPLDFQCTCGTECARMHACTCNIVQEVEVHGWLLSGIEELTIYALF